MSDAKPPAFWQTIPGILTGAAALVTAVTGLLVALSEGGLLGGREAESESARPASGIAALVGEWQGEASDGRGVSFQVAVTIAEECALDRVCGRMSVSHLPCEGRITLVREISGSFEFSVDDFTADSSAACTPGAGEFFRPRADGGLDYETSYDTAVSTVLRRVEE